MEVQVLVSKRTRISNRRPNALNFTRGGISKSAHMKKPIEMMVQLLDKNKIPLPKGARKKDRGSTSYSKERFHALVAGSSNSYSFIIDSGGSRNMASME